MKTKTVWIMVNVDKLLVDRIKKVMKTRPYTSVANYVQDCILRRLEPHETEDVIEASRIKRMEEDGY